MNKTKTIALAGFMCALHVIATLMLNFEWLPGLELVILFAAPFFSAIYSYKSKTVYCVSYFIATLLICLLISPANALLYILPTLTVGLAYGLLVKKNVDGTSIVYILTILEFGLFFLSAYLCKLFFDFNYIETLQYLFHITVSNKHLGIGLLLLYSFAQAFLIHIVTKNELKKIKVIVKKTEYPSFFIFVLGIASLIVTFIPFESKTLQVVFICCAVVFNVPLALYGYQIMDKVWVLVILQALVFLAVTLPLLLLVYKDATYTQLNAYLLMFLPPIIHGAFRLFEVDYVKKQN